MKTIRDSLSRRVRDQKQQRLDGEWELRRAAGFERRRSKSRRCAEEEEQSRAEQRRGQCAGPYRKWQSLRRDTKSKKKPAQEKPMQI